MIDDCDGCGITADPRGRYQHIIFIINITAIRIENCLAVAIANNGATCRGIHGAVG